MPTGDPICPLCGAYAYPSDLGPHVCATSRPVQYHDINSAPLAGGMSTLLVPNPIETRDEEIATLRQRVEAAEAREQRESKAAWALAEVVAETKQALARVEAQSGAMREALTTIVERAKNPRRDGGPSAGRIAEAALAPDAGIRVLAELEAARALVAALPRCEQCERPAKKQSRFSLASCCDEHALEMYADLPYAVALRAWEAARTPEPT